MQLLKEDVLLGSEVDASAIAPLDGEIKSDQILSPASDTRNASQLGASSSFISTFDGLSGQVGTIDQSAKFTQISSTFSFSDIAVAKDGTIFGITTTQLYKINPVSGLTTFVGDLNAGVVNMNALEFANDVLYAAGDSSLYTINTTNGAASLIANLDPGFISSGDLAFDAPNNRFLATSKGFTSDSLYAVSLTGQATKIGDIGFSNILALMFEGEKLFGFTADGARIAINPGTGAGVFDSLVKGISDRIGGASGIFASSAAFVNKLELSQDSLLVGESADINFSVKVANPRSVNEVQVFEQDTTGKTTILGKLFDNGDLQKGDDIAGDGVFTNKFSFNATNPAQKSYFATISGTQEKTQLTTLDIVAPISELAFKQTLDFNTQIDGQFKSKLNSGQAVAQALSDTKALLLANPSQVKPDSISTTDRALAWETQDGILVVLDADVYVGDGQRGGIGQAPVESLMTTQKSITSSVENRQSAVNNNDGCNKALVLGSYAGDFEPFDESNEIAQKLRDAGFDVIEKINPTESASNITVDDFKNLDKYDVISISSHGDNFDGKNFANGQDIVVLTGQKVNFFNGVQNIVDLVTKRLVLAPDNTYAITSSFIDKYTDKMPDSIVYISSCRSTFTDSLANVFLNHGAKAFIGYSDYVDSSFANSRGQGAFDTILAGKTTGQIPGINVDRETDEDPALFQLIGSDQATISLATLKNGGFEEGNFSCWTTEGDARTITALGPLSPPEGKQMAIISTGLGSVSDSNSSISQKFIVPENAKDILINYNVVSEEPLEFVGTEFDDQFDILLNGTTIVGERVNTSTWKPISGIDFSEGDQTIFETGFKEASFDLTPFRGKTVELKIRTFDRGDSLFDTGALIDKIRITTAIV